MTVSKLIVNLRAPFFYHLETIEIHIS